MSQTEFTIAQAKDVARYFLGPGWHVDRTRDGVCILSDPSVVYRNAGWRGVFRDAGVILPLRQKFSADGLRVMNGAQAACTAVSNTMAKRIAAALNEYAPNRRGR